MKTITLQKNNTQRKLINHKVLTTLLIAAFCALFIASVFAYNNLVFIGSILVFSAIIYRLCQNYYFNCIIPAIGIANYNENMSEIIKELDD